MSLHLDDRQRAMLAEMGVRVWQRPAPQQPTMPPTSTPTVTASASTAQNVSSAAMPQLKHALSDAATSSQTSDSQTVSALSPLPPGLAQMDWPQLQEAARHCRACALCEHRTHSVFAHGAPPADGSATDLLIVGDAPSDAEDASGQAFAGNDGALLDAMLHALGLDRAGQTNSPHSVVLVHAMKCRGPTQRHPSAEEIQRCQQYLSRQIALLRPRVILALGRLAAQTVLHEQLGQHAGEPPALGKLRGQVHQVQGCPVVVSYHPAYLLRTPADKARAWSDLCLAMDQLPPH